MERIGEALSIDVARIKRRQKSGRKGRETLLMPPIRICSVSLENGRRLRITLTIFVLLKELRLRESSISCEAQTKRWEEDIKRGHNKVYNKKPRRRWAKRSYIEDSFKFTPSRYNRFTPP